MNNNGPLNDVLLPSWHWRFFVLGMVLGLGLAVGFKSNADGSMRVGPKAGDTGSPRHFSAIGAHVIRYRQEHGDYPTSLHDLLGKKYFYYCLDLGEERVGYCLIDRVDGTGKIPLVVESQGYRAELIVTTTVYVARIPREDLDGLIENIAVHGHEAVQALESAKVF